MTAGCQLSFELFQCAKTTDLTGFSAEVEEEKKRKGKVTTAAVSLAVPDSEGQQHVVVETAPPVVAANVAKASKEMQ